MRFIHAASAGTPLEQALHELQTRAKCPWRHGPNQGEGGLRIDYCDGCHGYLKTYDGEGSESVLLADWTSLHLDLLARDRGLKRMAASLYEV
jgi:hypothetical protein